MNRRNFVSYLAAAGVALRSKLFGSDNGLYGTLTPEHAQMLRGQGVYLRVMVDGVDRSHDCRLANDKEGWADILLTGSDGGYLLEPPKYESIWVRRVRGNVSFQPVSQAEWMRRHSAGRNKTRLAMSKDNPQFREYHA